MDVGHLIAIGAGLAIGLAALGTGLAMARISKAADRLRSGGWDPCGCGRGGRTDPPVPGDRR